MLFNFFTAFDIFPTNGAREVTVSKTSCTYFPMYSVVFIFGAWIFNWTFYDTHNISTLSAAVLGSKITNFALCFNGITRTTFNNFRIIIYRFFKTFRIPFLYKFFSCTFFSVILCLSAICKSTIISILHQNCYAKISKFQ